MVIFTSKIKSKGMKRMILQNEKIEKTCCFYVSDFHLEMILVPYINNKIEENITILTEKNLKDTVETLVSKMNLKDENKEKILNLDWEGAKNIENSSNVIIIGTDDYIEKKHYEIQNANPLSVLDCYNFDEKKDNINNIVSKYNNTLNTLGVANFE